MRRFALATLVVGFWITIAEFLRNELFLKEQWFAKYDDLGLTIPLAPVNLAAWAAWGFILAGCVTAMSRRMSYSETLFVSWLLAFVLVWIILGNLAVLPYGTLALAIPTSFLELAVAASIARGILGRKPRNTRVR